MTVRKPHILRVNPRCHLLVVALKLLCLVVAACMTLPWAMEQSVGLGLSVLIEWVVPGGLTVSAGASSESWR